MIRPQLILDLNRELVFDNFAGGGGASMGIEEALGRHVDHAINHDAKALGMHRINHPQTVHHCEDVFDVEPSKLVGSRRPGFGWFSPDCKHHSKAKGGKPLDKKIRGLVLVMLRWASIRTRVMVMENVEEIASWGPLLSNNKPDPKHKGRTWRAFLDALGPGLDPNHPDIPEMLELLRGTVTKEQLVKGFGYYYEVRELRACDYGTPTIRKRLFMVARCDGMPIAWPKPTHAAPKDAKRLGLKPWRTIAECIDWSLPCPSIFLSREEARQQRCRRPLAKSTLRRLAAGVGRYVINAREPFIVNLTHQGGERVESIRQPANTITGANRGEKAFVDATVAPFIQDNNRPLEARTSGANEPMRTQCAGVKGGHFSLAAANLVEFHSPKRPGDERVKPVDAPLPTQTTEPRFGLAAMNLVKLRGEVETHDRGQSADEPGHTISAGGQHLGVSVAFLAQHNTGVVGHDAQEPMSTISSRGSQQQVVSAVVSPYFGSEADGQAMDESLRTTTTKARFGLGTVAGAIPPLTQEQIAGARRVAKFLRDHGVEFEGEFATVGQYVIVDIGMRMLTPRELFRAQGFPESYVIDEAWLIDPKTGAIKVIPLTKEEKIRMCGNSVCPPVAKAIVESNVPELAVWRIGERKAFEKRRKSLLPQRACV